MAAPKGFLKSAERYSSNCSMAWADNCNIHLTHQWKVFSRKVFLCKQATVLTGIYIYIYLKGKKQGKEGSDIQGSAAFLAGEEQFHLELDFPL